MAHQRYDLNRPMLMPSWQIALAMTFDRAHNAEQASFVRTSLCLGGLKASGASNKTLRVAQEEHATLWPGEATFVTASHL